MLLGSGYLEMIYWFVFREYKDGLIWRLVVDWSVIKFCSELFNVICYLYGLEEVDGKENSDECVEVSF